MPWLTESLTQYYGRAALAGEDFAYKTVDELGTINTNFVQQATPIATTKTRTNGRVPGTLRESVQKIPTMDLSHGIWISGAESTDPIAVDVEYGTGLFGPKHDFYIIRPRTGRFLRFSVWNQRLNPRLSQTKNDLSMASASKRAFKIRGWVATTEVHHPGSKGAHMFRTGLMKTEPKVKGVVDKNLNEIFKQLRIVGQRRSFQGLMRSRPGIRSKRFMPNLTAHWNDVF